MFKNTLPTKLYLILFAIEDLGQAAETAKRILTKEKLDKQLAEQSLSTPFMSIRDGHHRKVSFDTREELGNKIDKLAVMIDKLTTRESGTNRQFKPQIHQGRGRGQNRSYSQRSYQIDMDKITDQIAETEVSTEKIEVGLDMNHDRNRIIGEVILEGM